MPNVHRVLAPLFALAALVSAGCGGPDFDTLCQEREDCQGGNELDVEACIAIQEGQAEQADAIGCADEFDAYYECLLPELKCRNQSTGAACTTNVDCGGGCFRLCNASGAPCATDADCGDLCIGGLCTFSGAACTIDTDCAGDTCGQGVCTSNGSSCTADADCATSGISCSGGECVTKYYGTDSSDPDEICEAESNAYNQCD